MNTNTHTQPDSLIEYAHEVTWESIRAELERMEREDPAAYRNHERAQQALADGEISVFVCMDEEGLTYRQAKKVIADQDRRRRRKRAHPNAYKFRCQLEDLRHSIPKGIKSGEICYADLVSSPVPIYGIEMAVREWRKLQGIVPEWVPWKTPAQRAAYEQHFRYRQRALAVQVFSSFSIEKRKKHWRDWWQYENPPPNWRGWDEGQTKWTIHRNELQRQIERDQVGAF